MELLGVKLIVLALSGVIRLLFGLFPLFLMKTLTRRFSSVKDSKRIKYVISVLMFFGGGVLLATCFLHMMPEVRESLNQINLQTELPVPELIFIAGFFLVYMLEDLVHGLISRRRATKRKKRAKLSYGTDRPPFSNQYSLQNHGFRADWTELEGPDPALAIHAKKHKETNGFRDTTEMYGRRLSPHDLPAILPRVRSENTSRINTLSRDEPKSDYVDPEWWRDTVTANNSQVSLVSGSMGRVPSMHEIPLNGNSPAIAMTPNREPGTVSWSSLRQEQDLGHGHGHSHMGFPMEGDEDESSVAGAIRNLLIVIAISFHGIFEGLAIGLQGTEKDVWALFVAVSLHECTILFCIGVELISSQTRVSRMITYILVVSLVCPVGIAIGILISENSVGNMMVHALLVGSLQGLAAGTLLYVTFFEIFAAEGKNIHQKFVHIIVAILGFILMASLEFIGGHSHSHGHGHSHVIKSAVPLLNGTSEEHSHDHGQDHDDDHVHGNEDGHAHSH